jgi:hypothetical protein
MNNSAVTKALLVSLAVMISMVVGILAGILVRFSGQSIPNAVLKGAGAFAGTLALIILVLQAVGLLI